ncbi:MAG TPA: hypothetical protein VMT70_18285 [Vicinamibacteria bacterium]|nr:hypothetical protein [Vicinamibacteria bacterium]
MIFRGRTRSDFAGGVLLLLALGRASSAQTVDDVVRRYIEARGGLAKLRAVGSLRISGTMELPGVKTPFVLELKRPERMRIEFTAEGRTVVRAFDGRTAWEQLPLPGERPRPMSPEDAADARAQADVDLSPLVDPAAKGYTVELVGRDRLPGGDTWKLVVRGKEGPPRTMYLDARTHLVVETVDRRDLDGKEVEFVTDIGDYRFEGGLAFPHRMEVGPRGSPERQRLVVERIEINPPIEDARFAMPGPAAAGRTPVRTPRPVLP